MSLDLENINLGATAGDKTGDGARAGGGKINRNFEKIKTFLETPDAILVQTGYELVGQNLTFNSGWKWRIATLEYTNPEDVEVPFPLAASGKSRLDVVVLTTSNTFLRVVGAESTSTPVAPATPSGSLYVTVVLVTDGVVNQPEQPEVNGAYVQKSERANVVLTGSGIINQLDLVDEKATIVFKGSVTRLNTISYASVPYNGKRITLFNAQATPVTIGSSVSGYGVDFVFPDDQDYILLPNQTIEFSFDITYAPYAHHMFIGKSFDSQIEVSTNQNTNSLWNSKTILFTANCTITVPATLLSQYGFVFRTLAGVTVTWAITAPFTWETTPTTTGEKTTGSFMRRGSTNTILLDF